MDSMDISVPQPAPRYGHCETFFTETDDYDMASRVREHQRAMAKIRQRQLAKELSIITSDEYLEEILDHMEHMESITMPDVASIDIQHEIQWYMRPYLIDFIIEAHAAFQLLPETLYLTVNLLDRYCSRRVVYKRHYQLVGCAALLIASKYGDKKEKVPTFRELRSMCCNMYEEEMFLQMEWHVLQTLDWVIGHPTVDSFLKVALGECNEDLELEHMAWYICELGLYHKDFVSVRPSVMARSSLALARGILGRPQSHHDDWASRYNSSVVVQLVNYLPHPTDVLARKFTTPKLSAVAQTVETFLRTHPDSAMHDDVPSPAAHIVIQEPKPQSFGTPQTPSNKSAYHAAVMQHGCWTPPITPDAEQNNPATVAAAGFYPRPVPQYPATPSPVPSHHPMECHSTGPSPMVDSYPMGGAAHPAGSHHPMGMGSYAAGAVPAHVMGHGVMAVQHQQQHHQHPLASHPMGAQPRHVMLGSQPYDLHNHFLQPKPVQ